MLAMMPSMLTVNMTETVTAKTKLEAILTVVNNATKKDNDSDRNSQANVTVLFTGTTTTILPMDAAVSISRAGSR